MKELLVVCFLLMGTVERVSGMTLEQERVFQTRHVPREELRLMANRLGPVTEGAGFWLGLAGDSRLEMYHRQICAVLLLNRHVIPGMTVGEMAKVLGEPRWLKPKNITRVTFLGGWMPVDMDLDDTVIVIELLPAWGQSEAMCLRVAGAVDLGEIRDALVRGRQNAAWGARILETGAVLYGAGFGDVMILHKGRKGRGM